MAPVPLRSLLPIAFLLAATAGAAAAEPGLRVGSKRFTESYILGEIAVQSAVAAGAKAAHRPGMGNSTLLCEALRNDAIDADPESSGPIARVKMPFKVVSQVHGYWADASEIPGATTA